MRKRNLFALYGSVAIATLVAIGLLSGLVTPPLNEPGDGPSASGKVELEATGATLCTTLRAENVGRLVGLRIINHSNEAAELVAVEAITAKGVTIIESSLLPEQTGVVMDSYPPAHIEDSVWEARSIVGEPPAVVPPKTTGRLFIAFALDEGADLGIVKDLRVRYTSDRSTHETSSEEFIVRISRIKECSFE